MMTLRVFDGKLVPDHRAEHEALGRGQGHQLKEDCGDGSRGQSAVRDRPELRR